MLTKRGETFSQKGNEPKQKADAVLASAIFLQKGAIKATFDVVEAARAFSCEVDYSQENLDKLFAFAYRFIKI